MKMTRQGLLNAIEEIGKELNECIQNGAWEGWTDTHLYIADRDNLRNAYRTIKNGGDINSALSFRRNTLICKIDMLRIAATTGFINGEWWKVENDKLVFSKPN